MVGRHFTGRSEQMCGGIEDTERERNGSSVILMEVILTLYESISNVLRFWFPVGN